MFPNRQFKALINHLIIITLISSILGFSPVNAATLIVTNTNDSGVGSLRQTILSATAGDTITFAPNLSGATINLTTELTLSKNVTIDGSMLASKITISGDTDSNGVGDVRVFYIYNTNAPIVTLDGLIITKGTSTTPGGGILNHKGALTVKNCVFTNNSADTGGGIYNQIGTLEIINSSFFSNFANLWIGSAGGGIANDPAGTTTVTNSTFSNNSTSGFGGGISNYGEITITNSTFSNNSAGKGGGGIWNQKNLTVTNSTFSNNTAPYFGGGIGSNTGGATSVINSTFSGNSGGGIFSANGTLNYTNTIIANSSFGNDCVTNNSVGLNINNLVEDGSCYASLNGDPKLGELTNNGGQTQTFALLAGSNAIDMGNDVYCPLTDQRGISRPQGIHCDIGAFEEFQLPNPPVIIVHGWQGLNFSGGYTCDGIEKYPNRESTLLPDPDLENYTHLAEWLQADGYQVWIAHLYSNSSFTASIETNAKCLRNQIKSVWEENPQDITVIAHSMGGLVSRAAIRTLPANIDVDSLITLGSPHSGLPTDLFKLWNLPVLNCNNQPGMCNMSIENMTSTFHGFNSKYPNSSNVNYYFIGGNGGTGVTSNILSNWFYQGSNDGLVGQYSAVGWVYPNQISLPLNWSDNTKRYFTNETHPANSANNLAYYVAPDMTGSQSYQCIKGLMQVPPNTGNCSSLPANSLLIQEEAVTSQSVNPFVFSETHTGNLGAAEATSHSIAIDSPGMTTFYINWNGGAAPTIKLTRPDSVEIDKLYADTHSTEVTYEEGEGNTESAPYQAFTFPVTQTGVWQVNITAGSDPIEYQVFAMMESNRVLNVQTDKDVYSIGDNAVITATLAQNTAPIAGATVNANLTLQDSSNAIVPLIDPENDGTYIGSYSIPNKPGYFTIDVNANGNDNGFPFTRNATLISAIASNNLQLIGNYDDQPRDDGTDGIYDYLDFTIEVNLTEAGEYVVSAELYSGDQLITQTGDFFTLNSGVQTITLPFSGKGINTSELNGPYTVKNLYLTLIDIGITSASVETAWTTDPYLYSQFADGIAPEISAITRASGNPTSASSVDFTVTFSEDVTGVSTSAPFEDFQLVTSGVSGAAITGVSGSGSVYTVSVNTGSGNGTIRLDIPVGADITDLSGTPLSNLPYTGDESYSINKTLRAILYSTGSQDGWVLESSETSESGGTVDSSSTVLLIGDDASDRQYRSMLSFDTSSLPDTAVITQAVLSLRVNEVLGGGNPIKVFNYFMADMRTGSFGASSALAAQDFGFSPTVAVGPLGALNRGGWYYVDLKTGKSAINTTGLTQVRLRFSIGDNDNGIANIIKIYSGNSTVRPQLSLWYYVP